MAAQDAELKLKVSLDLAFFRQQLAGLGQAAAGYNMPIQVKFDRRSVQNELNALGANIRQRKYRLEVATNLDAEIKKARDLANALRSIPKGGGAQRAVGTVEKGFSQAALKKLGEDIKPLYKAAGDAGLVAFNKGIANNRDKIAKELSGVGKDSIAGLLNGLKSGDSSLQAAAKSLGKDLISSIKAVLGIASPSREFKKIGEDSGEGFEQGLKSGLNEATRMGVQEMRDLFRALQGEAKSGAARLQATMLAAMAGLVRLPGGREQRGRLAQSAGAINAAMTGAAAVNIGARQAGVRRQAAGAASATPAFMTALPMMFGMSERELMSRLQGLYGQQYRAPGIGTAGPNALGQLIQSLAGARGALGTGGGLTGQLFRGGAVNPGVLPSGYIGRSALSPRFVNYPPGMPAAYGAGFMGGGGAAYGMTPGRMQGPALPVRGVFSTASGSLGQFPSAGMMGPFSPLGSMGRFPIDNTLAIGGASAIAQKRAGSTPWLNTLRGAFGYVPSVSSSARFPMSGMMGPSSPLGVITAQSSMFGAGGGGMPPGGGGGGAGGGGGFMGGMGGFARAMGGVNLPGANSIRELGSEFGYATKQVLLFGQAYKALAFIQSFPGQVGAAVGQLQSFRNTLAAISPSANEAAASNRLILDLVDKYNTPLQSARDGFAKLYASMAPAGFSGNEIRDLFTGITKAAATFGMSADKVDRVNYAFAQMASKGQVMSEELKGQLGDVLPGAMALFAEAAGFKGPKAIQDFSAALEDGKYKGEAMVALLKNVGIVMNKEFGPGAEGAAKTFQGVINRMQNSMTLLYESFEPVAVGFLNTVVVPLTNGIKTVSDGFNAFFTGTAAKSASGSAFAQQLNNLKPAFEGIQQNISSLLPLFNTFSQALLGLGKVFIQIAGNPFTGFLLRTYLAVLPLVTAIKVLNLQAIIPMIASLVRAIPAFVAFNAAKLRLISTNKSLQLTMQLTGLTATKTATQIRTVGLALSTLVVPAVLLGIGALIERFMMLKGAVDGVRQSTQQMVASISSMANTGAVKELKNVAADTQKQIKTFESLRPYVSGGALGPKQKLTPEKAKQMEELGLGSFIGQGLAGPYVKDFANASKIIEERLKGLNKQASSVQEKLPLATKIAADIAKQTQSAQTLSAIPGSEGGDGKNKAAAAAAKAAEDARKLADDKAKYESDLLKMNNIQAIELDNLQFEHWKALQQEKYNILIAGENSWLSQAIKFQQQLQDVEISRIEAVRRAREATAKAEIDAGAKSYIAAGGGTGGVTGLLQGSTGISSGPHFDVRRADGGRITEAEARALFDAGVNKGLQMTSGYGPRNTGIPGASTFHRGIDLAGPANTPLNLAPGYSMVGAGMEQGLGYTARIQGPQGQMYKVGHLQQPSAGGLPASRVRAEAKKDYNAALAAQTALNKKEQESVLIKQANVEAQMRIAALIKEQVAAITPVEEQKLENQLIQEKLGLLSSGIFGERLDTEVKIAEATAKANLNIGIARQKIEENNALAKQGELTNEQLTAENKKQLDYISQQEKALADYIPLLRERLALEQSSAEATLRGELQRARPLGGLGLSAGFIGAAGQKYEEALGRGASTERAAQFAELQNQLTLLEARNEAIKESIMGIGGAFAETMTNGLASLVTGTASIKEVFTSFLKSIGETLLDAAGKMIATYIAIGIAKAFAFGASASAGASSSTPGVNVSPTGNIAPLPNLAGAVQAANGAYWQGGFKAFASGGMVTGPTMGLVGEGGEPEYIIPASKMQGAMERYSAGVRGAAVIPGNGTSGGTGGMMSAGGGSLDIRYTVERINSVDYVTADQFQRGMRQAVQQGAEQGERRALGRLRNSPATRRRVGM